MAVVLTGKSTAITNSDATPPVLNNPSVSGGLLHEAIGVCTIGATDSSTSTYRFCRIPSNARVSSILINTDAAPGGGTSTIDIGLYDTAANGSAVVGSDGDQFAAAVDFHTAALVNKEVAWSAEESKWSTATKMVWELLGLSSDPGKFYDLTGTLAADNSTGAVVMLVKVLYVI